MQRPAVVFVCLALSAACGSDDSRTVFQPDGPAGVGVLVTPEGGVSLFDGDPNAADARPLMAFADATPFAFRRFVETVRGNFAGLYTIDEFGAEQVTLDVFDGVEETAEGVVVRYSSSGEVGTTGSLLIASEGADATRIQFSVSTGQSDPATSMVAPIRCDSDGTFFGFGEQYNATEQTGEAFRLFLSEQGIGRAGGSATSGDKHTTYIPMPYYLDARGFGVAVETGRRVEVDICQTDASVASFEVVDGAPMELVLFHGPTPYDVIEQLGAQYGRPLAPPDWAWDVWIAAQGGTATVRADFARLQENDVPVGAMWVQDWTGIRQNVGGSGVEYTWYLDEALYPGFTEMVADFEREGVRFFTYANPFVDPGLPRPYAEMDQQDLLVKDSEGASYLHDAPNLPRLQAATPDFTNPATVSFVEDALADIVTDYGVDGWMLDFGEWSPVDGVLSDGGDPIAYHNEFPVYWQRVCRSALESVRPGGDYVYFARSGWLGVQEHAQIIWVGDQEADWEDSDGLPTVLPAMLNLGFAGLPFVTHDIAGFSGGPSTKELYQRWTELGAFTPIMRTHEGNDKENNWNWDSDADTIAHFRRFARIHRALIPELQVLANDAAATSRPMVRHLMLEYPGDVATYEVDDQFLLGPDLLVAPVIVEGATSREVYFPEGEWFNVWTGDSVTGPTTATIDAPIGQPPVFSRGEDRTDLRAIE